MSSIVPAVSGAAPLPVDPIGQAKGSGTGFSGVLENAIQTVEDSRHTAAHAVEKFLSGEGGELHTTILATQRASLSFDLFLQIRNKVVSAYQEIMRMQL